jgi:hypothetical protein
VAQALHKSVRTNLAAFLVCGVLAALPGLILARALDLRDAVVVYPPGLTGPARKAVSMLVEEAEKRSNVRWPEATLWPGTNSPVVAVGLRSELGRFAGRYAGEFGADRELVGAEGYRICSKGGHGSTAVFVIGNDARGVLFGVGRLLRELRFQRGAVVLDDGLEIATVPKYPLRGHQLGYRPKCNSYDAWDLPTWEQYFRDLAVFGCNAIELIPPRSDDDADSPHFPRPPMEMMIGMSRVAAEYGLAVWVWYPAMDRDYAAPATVEFALKEWGEVFRQLPRLDAVFVPGGDPGHTPPRHLLALLERQTQNLHRYHPQAQMWVSPQGFSQAWLDEFLVLLNQQTPAWLSGIVYGPQVRVSLSRLRALVPAQYPIRHYPDITHSRQCQFPVPDWDVGYAVTEGRECINPRPEGQAVIFRKTQPGTIGFLTYSEGCNDDVNKAVWSALGWDPSLPVIDILRAYSRHFLGEKYADDFAQGLLALERNWQGPLLANQSVENTLAQFQAMEKAASPADLKNWRFQQALFRAYYDAYVQRRSRYETELEARALECLARAPTDGALPALAAAERHLERAVTGRIASDLRLRVHQLAEALFQSIGMQLSVEKYKAIAVDRGASLDTLDYPLNNRPWLTERFERIRRLASEPERLRAIFELVHWNDAGPGGFYDDLGNVARQPHLVRGLGFNEDPGCFQSVRADFEEDAVVDEPGDALGVPRRLSWIDHAEPLYDAPLQMRYTGLDPRARYRVRVAYAGDNPRRKLRLVAAPDLEVHPLMPKPVPFKLLEFAVPPAAITNGELTLSWFGEPGLGGNGRGCQVSEVWLLKEPVPARP